MLDRKEVSTVSFARYEPSNEQGIMVPEAGFEPARIKISSGF